MEQCVSTFNPVEIARVASILAAVLAGVEIGSMLDLVNRVVESDRTLFS